MPHASVLDTIGGTRLLPLRHMLPEGSARILVKLEYENPTGSMRDRMALAMVEADGRLKPSGSHKIEGTGAGFVVPLWTPSLADEIQTVSTREAMETARRLARDEGIFAGTSTGANVAAALRVAARPGGTARWSPRRSIRE